MKSEWYGRAVYITSAKGSEGLLGFICTAGVLCNLRAYHSYYNLCEWCPLELCDTVA